MLGTKRTSAVSPTFTSGRRSTRPGRQSARQSQTSPEELLERIARLEKRMYQHARELEFEEAARLRDEIGELRRDGLVWPERKVN